MHINAHIHNPTTPNTHTKTHTHTSYIYIAFDIFVYLCIHIFFYKKKDIGLFKLLIQTFFFTLFHINLYFQVSTCLRNCKWKSVTFQHHAMDWIDPLRINQFRGLSQEPALQEFHGLLRKTSLSLSLYGVFCI